MYDLSEEWLLLRREVKLNMSFDNRKPIRLIELFAGIGSQAKALSNLGLEFEHWRVCEFDEHAIRSYNAVHGTNFTPSDITKTSATDLGIVDTDVFTYLLTYSFPCQDLSSAGKGAGMGRGSGTRSGLLWEVERLLTECDELPQVLLMENVPLVHGQKNISHFNEWIAFLESKGYSNYWEDLNAKDFGVPQNRLRCYMVSILGNHKYNFPAPETLTKTLGDLMDEHVDPSYYLTDVDRYRITNTTNLRGTSLQREVCKKAVNVTKPYDIIDYSYSNARLREIQDGTIFVRNKSDNSVSCTLTCHTSNFAVHTPDGAMRVFTPNECWRLMGFTDSDYTRAARVCNENQLYKQAGNSIVVDVLMAIFGELFHSVQERKPAIATWLKELLANCS
jgi:DNA (cytosine-5)-methyltransferase 1